MQSAKGKATVYIGDVDLTLWPARRTKRILRSQGKCAAVALGGEQRVACDAWNGNGPIYGRFVTVVAKGARVCGLMVCAKEKLFSPAGEALTAKAAELFDTFLREAGKVPGAKAAAAALIGATSSSDGSCRGYSVRPANLCPTGTVCERTYVPGDDVCR